MHICIRWPQRVSIYLWIYAFYLASLCLPHLLALDRKRIDACVQDWVIPIAKSLGITQCYISYALNWYHIIQLNSLCMVFVCHPWDYLSIKVQPSQYIGIHSIVNGNYVWFLYLNKALMVLSLPWQMSLAATHSAPLELRRGKNQAKLKRLEAGG